MSSRSTNMTSSRGSSVRSRHDARVIAQTPIDAKLALDFEESRRHFDYSSSVDINLSTSTGNIAPSTVTSYLQKMQRGSLVQSFGCLIAIDEQDFRVLAYSENAPEMLELAPVSVPNIQQHEALTFSTDVRTIFDSAGASALEKAVRFPEVNLLNPLLVHCKNSGKPFYAILHRIDVGLVLDLEPVNVDDIVVTSAGALISHKLAAKAISRLQAVPSHNIHLLCEVLVKEVSELTGYDRIMVYKFHEDEHGEVIAEHCRSELEPYLGLHYPATDIPQASRFLFLKNKVRMICDSLASPVKVIQDEKLIQPLSLGGSTLRAPHGCHAQYMANMGTIASLVMAVTINEEDDEVSDRQRGRKLWGLVVCHHTESRFVPFPQRYACEFLIQVFGIHINKEIELAAQMREKHILRIQTVLCDMLMRDSPVAIVTQSPNMMDLVKCDGAALLLNSQVWLLGVTPTEQQIRDLAQWLLEHHGNTRALSTDSLKEAGYHGASKLGDAVCGMVAIRITSKDFLFWFRSHTAKEVKWGGAKHEPVDTDNRRKMHPRSSFKAFLEVVKWRSLPWEDMEMDAVNSLQLILRGLLKNSATNDMKTLVKSSKMIVNVPGIDNTLVNKLQTLTSEMIRLIETAAVPIFSVDASGVINGWNVKMAEITGLLIERAIGLPLVDVVAEETVETIKNLLSMAMQGIEEKDVEVTLRTFGFLERNCPVVVVNACCSWDSNKNVTGICFIGQDVTLQKSIMEKYTELQGDYTGIMRNANHLIPPIFIMDEQGLCLEWNDAMEKLSGFTKEEAIGQVLLGDVFTTESIGCQLKDHDTLIKLRIVLNKVLGGEDADKVSFTFIDRHSRCIESLLSASPRTDAEGKITGVMCFLHLPSPELQYTIHLQRVSKKASESTHNKLAYLREQIRNPIQGIKFIRQLAESSELSGGQNQLLVSRSLCEDQLMNIIEDTDIPSIEECYMETKPAEFNLGDALEAVMSQVMLSSQEIQVQLMRNLPADVSSMCLYGDNLRLQQVLSDFLTIAFRFTPAFSGSSVMFIVNPRRESIGAKMQLLHVEFRIVHPSPGVPEDLIQEMFHRNNGMSREGLGLYISHKLVRIMNGTMEYVRGEDFSSFVIRLEFPLIQDVGHK
ncbi:phytochrome C isoform X1 [Amaranthus tricolor]|uniref:phytochrome C isoform X1 n=1 Tax=Amaranthus tricolor TaxID=29722 RepID=UPI00258D15A7|nr:phytochrome C isoform X1 [Amaranthus tricolor]XP_057526792.1 phytochrome C isoform X1 [Amaranthus tricolor]XP_057526793.1 phytochrome C isoform X1 [Amaranthus tricolor]XP_057526794.1 phytochrome C isoform X1 [Amaranthus tricolor]XP_057526795.1 phytochrome C isoform X1 [Amaranthus tricolor]